MFYNLFEAILLFLLHGVLNSSIQRLTFIIASRGGSGSAFKMVVPPRWIVCTKVSAIL